MNQQLIEQAIRSKSVIEFNYSNHHRVVEPHVLGVKDGVVQFLGYQIGGSSSSGGPLPEWRRFELGKISGLAVTDNIFPGRRQFPSGRHSAWDRQILVVDA
jgi:Predicted transcriptional regulator